MQVFTLCIPQYGEEHVKEVESLWCALCTWQCNIRITLNYLARLTCVSGNVALMMQQAKRIAVCFSRSKAKPIVTELIKDLKVSAQHFNCFSCWLPGLLIALSYM